MSILKVFSSSNYLPVNLCVARALGLEVAVMLGELASEHEYWEGQMKLSPDGYFYATVEKVEARTTLSKHKQLTAINQLKALGLIDVALKGLPSKRHFKINLDKLFEFFSSSQSNDPKTHENTDSNHSSTPNNEPTKFSTFEAAKCDANNTECVSAQNNSSFPQLGLESHNAGDPHGENRITATCSNFEQLGLQKLDTNNNIIYKNIIEKEYISSNEDIYAHAREIDFSNSENSPKAAKTTHNHSRESYWELIDRKIPMANSEMEQLNSLIKQHTKQRMLFRKAPTNYALELTIDGLFSKFKSVGKRIEAVEKAIKNGWINIGGGVRNKPKKAQQEENSSPQNIDEVYQFWAEQNLEGKACDFWWYNARRNWSNICNWKEAAINWARKTGENLANFKAKTNRSQRSRYANEEGSLILDDDGIVSSLTPEDINSL